jgi:hypothetical protein
LSDFVIAITELVSPFKTSTPAKQVCRRHVATDNPPSKPLLKEVGERTEPCHYTMLGNLVSRKYILCSGQSGCVVSVRWGLREIMYRSRRGVVMARVEWSRRTAEEVETVIGVMLCRANPAAIRVRPSQGDKGVDVYVPKDGKWTVYQVKSFTGSLTSSQKRQIRKSWESFLRFVEEKSLVVEAWYLIRPENPTWEDQEWLEHLTDGAGFPCSWQGLDHCEALAADHQPVVDYYLFDGKDRLQEALRHLLTAMQVSGASADLTTPADAVEGLDSLHVALNSHDPHYRYDFTVQRLEEGQLPLITDQPGLVAAVTRGHGGTAVTFRILERYREATSDRPVPGRFTLVAEPGTAEAGAVRDFVEYGIPIASAAARDLDIDLPGGLGGSHEEGTITLGPARLDTAQPSELDLVILDSDDAEVAVAELNMEPATTGLDGKRFAVSGQERYGTFSMVMRANPVDERLNMSFTANELTGKAPADVLPGLNALAAMRPPNRFFLRLRNGPVLDQPHDIPEAIASGAERLIRICDALATIQKNTLVPIRVPDLTETNVDEAREWMRVARLLNGDVLSMTWNRVAVELRENVELPDVVEDAFTVATHMPLAVKVADADVDLGFQLAQLTAARIDEADLDNGRPKSSSVHFIPAGDNSGTVRWVGRPDPSELGSPGEGDDDQPTT